MDHLKFYVLSTDFFFFIYIPIDVITFKTNKQKWL